MNFLYIFRKSYQIWLKYLFLSLFDLYAKQLQGRLNSTQFIRKIPIKFDALLERDSFVVIFDFIYSYRLGADVVSRIKCK